MLETTVAAESQTPPVESVPAVSQAPDPEQKPLPLETPQANDNTPEPSESQPETAIAEKIKRKASAVFEKFGVQYKRGGGRPRKDGMPNKADIPLNVPATAVPAVAAAPTPLAPQPGLDPELVRSCCSALAKAASTVADRKLHRAAKLAGYSPAQAQDLINNCAISETELNSFSQLAEICLRKYGVGTQYAPEVGIVVIAGGVGVRYMLALKDLSEQAEQSGEGKQ